MNLFVYCLTFFCFACVTFSGDMNGSHRLPEVLEPTHYTIALEPDFDAQSFLGNVLIELLVLQETNTVILHSYQLHINNISIFDCSNSSFSQEIVSYDVDEERQLLTVYLIEDLPLNLNVCIDISYEGSLAGNTGFYLVNYTEDNGNYSLLATTNFQPIHARKAFPCLDEPAFKAEFTIKVVRPSNYISLSNMPVEETVDLGGYYMDIFQRSLKMSTYLLGVTISTLHYSSSEFQTIFARRGMIDEGRTEFALEIINKTLNKIEDLVDISYDSIVGEINNVAIPNDEHSFQAATNWALITYGEEYLLSREGITATYEKQLIVETIANRYGQICFGNLVTPSWWDSLWITESLAAFIQHYTASQVEFSERLSELATLTSWRKSVDFINLVDALTSNAGSTSEILALFDDVNAEKGGFLIRMMQHFLTAEVFRQGLNKLLIERKYGVVTEFDLWNVFQEVINEYALKDSKPVIILEEIMKPWISQDGFPLLTVEVNFPGKTVTIQQEKISLNSDLYERNNTWYIPLTYTTANDPDFSNTEVTHWLTESVQRFTISGISSNDWFLLNKQLTGLYRINYDSANWNLLIDFLNSNTYRTIHPLNRAQLVDDSLNLARTGRLDYHTALNLINYLRRETDYLPIYSLLRNLEFLDILLSRSTHYDLFREFVLELLETCYQRLTPIELESDDPIDKLHREDILQAMCEFGHLDCLVQMNSKLRTWEHISPDLQSAVYCGGLRSGGEEEWNHLYELYKSSGTERLQKNRILSALGCTDKVNLLERLVDMSFARSDQWTVDTADEAYLVFTSLYRNSPLGHTLAFSNVLNLGNIINRFTVSQVKTILDGVSIRAAPNLQDLLAQFLGFQSEEVWEIHQDGFNRVFRNFEEVNKWRSTYMSHVNDWLENRLATPTTPPTTIVSSTTKATDSTTDSTTDTETSTIISFTTEGESSPTLFTTVDSTAVSTTTAENIITETVVTEDTITTNTPDVTSTSENPKDTELTTDTTKLTTTTTAPAATITTTVTAVATTTVNPKTPESETTEPTYSPEDITEGPSRPGIEFIVSSTAASYEVTLILYLTVLVGLFIII